MAVLIEAISVVVRRDAIDKKMAGGWAHFKQVIPNMTFCHDDEVARVGFLDPSSVGEFIEQLNSYGLTYLKDDVPIDMIVVDQQGGPAVKCDWIQFARVRFEDSKVAMAWLWEGSRGFGIHMPATGLKMATPPDWRFDGSLSKKFEFVPNTLTSKSKH